MADSITVKDTGAKFTPHIEGTFAAVCADVIDLGQRVEQYQGQPARIVDKIALVFITDSEGETKDVSVEFTASMNERASLRQFLEKFRGRSYTEDQAREGIPLDKLVGKPCSLTIEHKKSQKGRTYAKIVAVAPLNKQVPAPDYSGYKRPDFWAERVKAYQAERERWADAQMKLQGPVSHVDDDDIGF